ncbi:MAG: HD domain-containing protein [Pirellulales bacterium]|nr:HD domain-containing protein [Pirellulales bacterium]
MSDTVTRAAAFAKAAHESINQRRKYTDIPYIVHPEAVAGIVAEVTNDEAMIAAAWLHDVVEDTPVTLDEVRDAFGDDIAQLVDDLTDIAERSDGNRSARLAIDREHSAKASARAKTVKLADLIHNLSDVIQADPGFARKYIGEKQRLLEVLTEGDAELYRRVEGVIQDGLATLAEQERRST